MKYDKKRVTVSAFIDALIRFGPTEAILGLLNKQLDVRDEVARRWLEMRPMPGAADIAERIGGLSAATLTEARQHEVMKLLGQPDTEVVTLLPALAEATPQPGTMVAIPTGKIVTDQGKTIESKEVYSIAQFTVTVGEFARVTGVRRAFDDESPPNEPVVRVSWYDAVSYCNLVAIEEGHAPAYDMSDVAGKQAGAVWMAEPEEIARASPTGLTVRLPSETQWEFACRNPNPDQPTYGPIEEIAVFGRTRPAPVGTMKPNGYNLYDLYGNVWEWLQE